MEHSQVIYIKKGELPCQLILRLEHFPIRLFRGCSIFSHQVIPIMEHSPPHLFQETFTNGFTSNGISSYSKVGAFFNHIISRLEQFEMRLFQDWSILQSGYPEDWKILQLGSSRLDNTPVRLF
jgi:hypothetical protein